MSTILVFLVTWLQQYGYPALWVVVFVAAVGIPLPTSLVLLAAGAFAELGDFNVLFLALIAISASLCGDTLGYLIGRRIGSKVLIWLGRLRWTSRTVARSQATFKRQGGWAILLSRFLVSALGSVINLFAGADHYPYRRFLLYDVAGEILGAVILLTLGYIFGASWEAVGDLLGTFSIFVLAFLVAIILVFRLITMMRHPKEAGQQSLLATEQADQTSALSSEVDSCDIV
ncbi:MAG: DedA family protein [Chloroflexota bacterium]|nr:DedA family protein [Chloroflexota bacterium]